MSHSTFLRSSAVYGSNQSTVFSETSLSSQARRTTADRSAVGGYQSQNPSMVTTYQLQSQSVANSRTNSPARAAGDSPARRGNSTSNANPLFTPIPHSSASGVGRGHPSGGAVERPAAAASGRYQAPPSSSSTVCGGGLNTPTRRRGAHTPERARSPITGEFMPYGGGGSTNRASNSTARERSTDSPTRSLRHNAAYTQQHNYGTGVASAMGRGAQPQQQYSPRRAQQQQQQQQPSDGYYYIDSRNGSRANSPSASAPQSNASGSAYASRTSSIGRGSSAGGAYHSGAMPAAGVSSAAGAVRREGSFGKARPPAAGYNNVNANSSTSAGTVTRGGRTLAAPEVLTTAASSSPANNNNNNNNVSTSSNPLLQQTRSGGGVRRAGSGVSQNYGSFHISHCAPVESGRNSPRRGVSPTPRADPAQMKPAGVSTPRQRFEESPIRVPSHRFARENHATNFGGSDAGSLIFNSGVSASGSRGTSVSGLGTPTRGCNGDPRSAGAHGISSGIFGGGDRPTGVRRIDPPKQPERNGLWVRTRNKDDVVHLGVKGRGQPPPDGKVDETFSVGRKPIQQPQNIHSASCHVVAEESEPRKAKHNPIPAKPYNGFVIPPFRVDKDALGKKIADGLEPEVFMEPFGRDYRHRRHFDPYDSVRGDIQHSHLAPTQSNGRLRGTALVDGKGPLDGGKDILNLSKYTPEELGERLTRHNYMVGPPAFVPEPVKPYRANTNYRPQRAGALNSPTNLSSLDFGTAASVARAQAAYDSPMRSSTPRGPKMGVYSPSRNATRPF